MARNDLKGKVVLIAGGAKNLGGLLSRDFASKGAKVAIHYNSDSTKTDAEKTLADITNAGGEAFLFQADLTDVKNITKLFDATIEKFGGIDADGVMKTAEETKKWIESDIISRQGKVANPEFTVISKNEVVVTGQYSSRGYTNKANFLFTVENGLITSWRMRY